MCVFGVSSVHAVRVSGLLGISAVQYGRGDLCVLLGLLVYTCVSVGSLR